MRIFAFVALLLAPICIHAQDSKAPGDHLPVSRLASWNSDWAFADFDGDKQPDLAIAEIPDSKSSYRISLRLSGNGQSSAFDVQLNERSGLTISAQDVDGDHDLDLVITSGILGRPVGVWINDGAGNFTQGDSSLYPDQIWRRAPTMFSRSSGGEFPNALPEQSRLVSPSANRSWLGIRSSASRPHRAASRPADPFLPGQLRVRPPPAALTSPI